MKCLKANPSVIPVCLSIIIVGNVALIPVGLAADIGFNEPDSTNRIIVKFNSDVRLPSLSQR